jgi:hypothetical protein
MDERDLQNQTDRAEHARRLLNDPLLAEAIQTIRNECVRAWVASGHDQGKEREGFWMFAKTVDNFELLLKGWIETGKLAADKLNVVQAEKRGLRRVFG